MRPRVEVVRWNLSENLFISYSTLSWINVVHGPATSCISSGHYFVWAYCHVCRRWTLVPFRWECSTLPPPVTLVWPYGRQSLQIWLGKKHEVNKQLCGWTAKKLFLALVHKGGGNKHAEWHELVGWLWRTVNNFSEVHLCNKASFPALFPCLKSTCHWCQRIGNIK